jgi:protein SCO1
MNIRSARPRKSMGTFLVIAAILLSWMNVRAAARTYSVRGLILSIDKPHKTTTISVERIPDYMDAMVMPFTVRNVAELDGLGRGTMIEFTLVVDGADSYIQGVHIHQYESVEADPVAARRLKLLASISDPEADVSETPVGSKVPDFLLIDQNHRLTSLSQFSGKVVALTFTYTHCVLPNFCFRIANNFRQLQGRFAEELGKNLIFISITFDPAHDTPDMMAKYGKTWNADPNSWRLLTGEPSEIDRISRSFGVSYWKDEGVMIHSLHTVVINRDGTLAANLEGNEFTSAELGDLIQTDLTRPRVGRNASGN